MSNDSEKCKILKGKINCDDANFSPPPPPPPMHRARTHPEGYSIALRSTSLGSNVHWLYRAPQSGLNLINHNAHVTEFNIEGRQATMMLRLRPPHTAAHRALDLWAWINARRHGGGRNKGRARYGVLQPAAEIRHCSAQPST